MNGLVTSGNKAEASAPSATEVHRAWKCDSAGTVSAMVVFALREPRASNLGLARQLVPWSVSHLGGCKSTTFWTGNRRPRLRSTVASPATP